MPPGETDRFLDEALAQGLLTKWQVDTALDVADVLAEVQVALSTAEICVRKGFLTDDQAADIERRLAQRKVAKYEVLDRLGEGGTGVVWRARDTALGRIVALKLLSSRVRTSGAYHERFLREARVAVRLSHVNLVRGLDFGEADGYRYFAMEFVPGTSLAERLREDFKLPEREVVELALQAVDALAYVRQFELVHRDLKPDNLLITPTGRLKICDFGLAKPTTTEAAVDAPEGQTAGTPAYMSPEQIRAPATVDWRSDVYGLGATLYHALTGRPPFEPQPGRSVIHAHLEEVPPDPREIALDVGAGIAAVLLKMLRKRPEDRYLRLEQLRDDLEAVRDGRPPVHTVTFARRMGDTSEVEIVRDGLRLEQSGVAKVWAWVGAAVALAALSYGAHAAWQASRPDAPSPPSDTSRAPQPSLPRTTPSESTDPDRPQERPTRRRRLSREDEELAARSFKSLQPLLDGEAPELARAAQAFDVWFSEYRDATIATEVRAARDQVRARLAELAVDELEERKRRARTAVLNEQFAEASRVLREFPPEFRDTPAAIEADELASRRLREAETWVARRLAEAEQAIDRLELEDARSLHARAAANRTVATSRRVDEVAQALDRAEGARDQERREHHPRFVAACGRTLLIAGEVGIAAARRYAAEEFERPALRSFGLERLGLARDLDLLDRFLAAALPDVPRDELVSAILAEEAGDDTARLEQAAEQLDQEGSATPARALLVYHLSLGDLEAAGVRSDELDDAQERIGQVRTVLSAQVELLLHQAQADLEADRLTECARRLDEASEVLAGHAATALLRGRLALALSRPDEAEEQFRSALEIPEAAWWLGRTLASNGRPAEARDSLESARQRLDAEHPLQPLIRAELGRVTAQLVLEELGPLRRKIRLARGGEDWREVVELTTRVLELQPEDEEARYWRGLAADELGGRHVFEAWRTLRVLAERRSGRFRSSAKRRLERIEEDHADVSPVALEVVHRADLALAGGHGPRALELYERALDASPFLLSALLGRAECLLELARATEEPARARLARAAFEGALERHPDSADAKVGLADALLELNEAAEAARLADVVLETDAVHARALQVAGDAHLASDDAGQSLSRYEVLQRVQPGAAALMGQARALEAMGRHAAAFDRLVLLSDRFPIPPDLDAEFEAMFRRLQHAR